MSARDSKDAAVGALLGACVGDAAGAYLEFIGHVPSRTEVERALSMPGGGIWGVAPGQITDDGELTLCLALALSEGPTFDLERIAGKYAAWIQSQPFDIGNTTSQSLGCFLNGSWEQLCRTQGYAAGMAQAAEQFCMDSKANGSLMRASPFGIWGYQLSDAQLAAYALQDSALSHPNPSCCHAVACYTLAIAHLVANPGDRPGAFARAENWANRYAVDEVRGWLLDAKRGKEIPYQPQDGFVRIGFTHAFRHLRVGSTYVDAVRETLAGGGDTDTNSCIIGGLVGAACGARSIPESMTKPVLQCDITKGQWRPEFLQAKQIPELADRLFEHSPAT